MLKLGELLKSKRKDMGLTLAQVSENTKIPIVKLRALEEARYGEFSSEVYLQGFLKNYAKSLGIDMKKALAIYRRDRENMTEEGLDKSSKPIEDPKPIITPGRLVFFVSALIVIGVVVFLYTQVTKIIQPPTLELTEPLNGRAPNDLFIEVDTDEITISGKSEVGSTLLINGNEVTTNNLQEFRVENYGLNPGSNEIFIVAESYYFSKTSQIKLTVVSNTTNEEEGNGVESTGDEEEEEEQEQEQEEENSVETMEAQITVGSEEAWLVVDVDGEPKTMETVLSGEELQYSAKEELKVFSPRPQLITLVINGQEYDIDSQIEYVFTLEDGEIIES